jgi:hypothetical protein
MERTVDIKVNIYRQLNNNWIAAISIIFTRWKIEPTEITAASISFNLSLRIYLAANCPANLSGFVARVLQPSNIIAQVIFPVYYAECGPASGGFTDQRMQIAENVKMVSKTSTTTSHCNCSRDKYRMLLRNVLSMLIHQWWIFSVTFFTPSFIEPLIAFRYARQLLACRIITIIVTDCI